MSFLQLMLPYALLALAMLFVSVLIFGSPKTTTQVEECSTKESDGQQETALARVDTLSNPTPRPSAKQLAPWFGLFALALLAVARILPYGIVVVVTLVVAYLVNKQALRNVDYGLLVTFAAFFVFVGNVGRLDVINQLVVHSMGGHELVASVIASQVLSNVPTAILLSGFTKSWSALIIGTNIGGLGTLIASMASLISYKQLALALPHAKSRYILTFTAWNLVFLFVLLGAALLLS